MGMCAIFWPNINIFEWNQLYFVSWTILEFGRQIFRETKIKNPNIIALIYINSENFMKKFKNAKVIIRVYISEAHWRKNVNEI